MATCGAPTILRCQYNTNLHLDILDSSEQSCSFALKHKGNEDATMQRTTYSKLTDMAGKPGETVCPGKLNRKSCNAFSHPIRDWNCVCLDEAQMSPNFMKKATEIRAWHRLSSVVWMRRSLEWVNMVEDTHHLALLNNACFFICLAQSAFPTGWRVQDHKTVSSGFWLC